MSEIVDNLSEEERLAVLVQDYYDQAGTSLISGLRDIASGKSIKRAQEIGGILGLSDKDVMQLFMGVNLLTMFPTKEETLAKASEAFSRGTRGGQSTGSVEGDRQIEKIAIFTRLAIEKCWELKQKKHR